MGKNSSLPAKYVLHRLANHSSASGRGVRAWHYPVLSLCLPGDKSINGDNFLLIKRKSHLYAWVRGLMDLGVPPKLELRLATLVSRVGVPTAMLYGRQVLPKYPKLHL